MLSAFRYSRIPLRFEINEYVSPSWPWTFQHNSKYSHVIAKNYFFFIIIPLKYPNNGQGTIHKNAKLAKKPVKWRTFDAFLLYQDPRRIGQQNNNSQAVRRMEVNNGMNFGARLNRINLPGKGLIGAKLQQGPINGAHSIRGGAEWPLAHFTSRCHLMGRLHRWDEQKIFCKRWRKRKKSMTKRFLNAIVSALSINTLLYFVVLPKLFFLSYVWEHGMDEKLKIIVLCSKQLSTSFT